MNLARQMAERIVAVRSDTIPAEAMHWARISVMDVLGVTFAGCEDAAPAILAEVLDLQNGEGASLVFGTAMRTRPLDAALLNGVASHVLDFDDTATNFGGHISAVMVPALIAAAESVNAGGRDLLTAYVAGYETGAKIGRAVNPLHSEKGWHPTSTLGIFAVAAACSRLLGLDAEQTATALAISTSLAAGNKANFGTMTKSLHVGQCARGGLMVALLARKGYTGNHEAFTHKQGFFNLFNGAGNYHAERILDTWNAPLDILEPGTSFKLYPCCYSTHSPVEAALNLVRNHGRFEAGDIARVESWTAAARLAHTDRADPQTGLEAKFSVQYCVARALIDGKVSLKHFEDDAWREPAMRELLPRVHAMPHFEGQFPPELSFGAEVNVALKNGKRFSSRVDKPLGRTARNPIPPEQLRAKFEDCAAHVLPPHQVATVARALDNFESIASMRDFTRLLEVERKSGTVRKTA